MDTKLPRAAFVPQCVGPTQDEWGLWCLDGLVSSVLAFGCVYTNVLEKTRVAVKYKCRHLLASLSPLGPPHPVVSGYGTIEASSQLGAKTEHCVTRDKVLSPSPSG